MQARVDPRVLGHPELAGELERPDPRDVLIRRWRHRRHYDMRAMFITLALEDGADPHLIETRVTHTRKKRSAFEGYNRGSSGSGRAPRSRS